MLFKPLLVLLVSLSLSTLVACQGDDGKSDQPSSCAGFSQTGTLTCKSHTVKVYEPNRQKVINDSPSPVSYTNRGNYKYVTPGVGACGDTYRDSSMVACISPGYFPDSADRAAGTPCDKWIEVQNNGRTVQVRATDKCLGAKCNEVWLSKQALGILGGTAAIESGHLSGPVSWRFLKNEPWWACDAGLAGLTYEGHQDSCRGHDDYGCPRQGRRLGKNRIVGPAVYDQCKSYGERYDPPFDKHVKSA